MTATSWDIKDHIIRAEQQTYTESLPLPPRADYISNLPRPEIIDHQFTRFIYYYKMTPDYSSYRLHFFSCAAKDRVRTLMKCINPLPSEDNKWLIFVDRKSNGRKLKNALEKKLGISDPKESKIAYIDAMVKSDSSEDKDSNTVNDEEEPSNNEDSANSVEQEPDQAEAKCDKNDSAWNKIITEQKFDEYALISTSVIENGVNIIDTNVKNIAIFSTDRTQFIQLLGRKRLQKGEIVDLRVWVPNEEYFINRSEALNKDLSLANDLINGWHMHRITPTKYGNAVRELWRKRSIIKNPSLFFVDEYGSFHVHSYIGEILSKHLKFYRQFISYPHPFIEPPLHSFQDIVTGWLNLPISSRVQRLSDLKILLEKGLAHGFSDAESISFLRASIVASAEEHRLNFDHPERKKTFGPDTLNPLLSQLGLAYHIEQKKKTWYIYPRSEES